MKYIIELVADSKGLDPAIAAMNELRDAEKQLKTETSSVSAEQKKMMDAYATKAKLGKESIDKLMDGYKQLGKAATGAFGGEAIKGATKQAESFRAQLRASREELTKLLQSGEATTSQIYDMARAGGEIKDSIGDAQQAISVLASDTFKLDAALQGVQVGAAGFQVLAGGAALFGSESEDLQKTLVKLNAIMAITNGLKQIQDGLQKQTALSLGLNIVAQKTYALVVGESTGAMASFRLVLATLTGGVIIAGIVALVMNFDRLKEAIGGYSSRLQDSLDIKQKQLDLYDEMDAAHDNEIKKLQLEGAGQEKLIKLSQAFVKQKIDEVTKVLELSDIQLKKVSESYAKGLAIANGIPGGALFAKLFFAGDGDIEKAIKQNKELAARLTKLKGESLDLDLQLKGIYDKKKEESDNAAEKLEKERIGRIAKLREESETLRMQREKRDAEERDKRRLIEDKKAEEELRERNKREDEIRKENLKKIQDYEDKIRKARADREQADNDRKAAQLKEDEDRQAAYKETAIQVAQETANAIFQIVNANRNAEFNLQIQRLNELRTKELANKELTDSQRARVEERYQRKIAEIKTKQAIADRNAALAQAIINGALAITKTIASLGLPAAIPAVVAVASQTALQVAIIGAQKIPKFAKGTEYVNGSGTETSDSIPAMLSRGERVIDAKTNKLLKGIPNALIPDLLIPKATMIEKGMDYDKMAKAFSKELAANPKLMVNFNKSGFETFIISGNTTTNVKNNRNDF